MKKLKLFGFFVFFHLLFPNAQTLYNQEKSLAERLGIMENKMNNFKMFMNFRTNFYLPIGKDLDQRSSFSVDQLRLDMMGNFNDRLSYHFRQRLNKSAGPGTNSTDKISRATDFAFLNYKINDKLSVAAGKQAMAIGTIEGYYSGLTVYQYADLLQNMNVFYTGVSFTYKLLEKHDFHFQVLNNSTHKLSSMYNEKMDENARKVRLNKQGIKDASIPLGYVFNWNALWNEGTIHTRSSYSLFQEAKNKYWKMLALGAQFRFRPLVVDVDYIRSDEDVDLETYGTAAFQKARNREDENIDDIATNVLYNSYILKLNYPFNKRWSAFVKGMYETAYSNDFPDRSSKNFRSSYSYLCGLEYFPLSETDNLRLYLFYRGQQVKSPKDLKRINDFSIGLSYRIKML